MLVLLQAKGGYIYNGLSKDEILIIMMQIYRSHNMLYHGPHRVKLLNLSKNSRLLSLLRLQAFQLYMISDVVFW